MIRFSTCPSVRTRTARAHLSPIGTNSKCCSSALLAGDSTRLAHLESPESVLLVLSRSSLMLMPRAAHSPSIDRRSFSGMSGLNSISPSTNSRKPVSVGMRPAEVCGANSRPASSRSLMLLRIEAGDRSSAIICDRVFDPTGWPPSMYAPTSVLKISIARGERPFWETSDIVLML